MHRIQPIALAASLGLGLAARPSDAFVAPAPSQSTVDSLRLADSALIEQTRTEFETALREQHEKDSILFTSHLPEELRAKVEEAATLFAQQKRALDSMREAEPQRIEEFKSTVDQWRQVWEARRDSQVAKIADSSLRVRIQNRITQVSRSHANIFAQLRERRMALQGRIEDLRRRNGAGSKTPNP